MQKYIVILLDAVEQTTALVVEARNFEGACQHAQVALDNLSAKDDAPFYELAGVMHAGVMENFGVTADVTRTVITQDIDHTMLTPQSWGKSNG